MEKVRYSSQVGTYPRAQFLMEKLRAADIDCNIDVGCVAIYCSADQKESMIRICQEVSGTEPYEGSDSILKDLTLGGARERLRTGASSSDHPYAYTYTSETGVHESITDLVFSGHTLIAETGTIITENEPFERE
jgi:hypothetical protein